MSQVRDRLADLHIEAQVVGRPKHYWSIYEKMIVKGKGFDDVQDLVGVRVVVDSVKDCYGALGLDPRAVGAGAGPLQGLHRDAQVQPLPVAAHDGGRARRASRSRCRSARTRCTAAPSSASPRTGATRSVRRREDLAWLQRMVDWQQDTDDPAEFMDTLKIDLEQDEVFVFTPKGKVITLPTGATPVDFAYAIHTEVGHRCIGARVNGRLVPLDSALESGDTVEIFTSKVDGAGPSRDWLQFVHTPEARSKIRQWFSRERRVDAIDTGRDELVQGAPRKEGLPVQKLAQSQLRSSTSPSRCTTPTSTRSTRRSARATSRRTPSRSACQRELRGGEEQLPVTTQRPPQLTSRRRRRPSGVHVEGLDDVMVRLSRCCTPVPGDEIMGFVTRGRGVSVHRTDCANADALAAAGAAGHRGRVGPRPDGDVRGVGRDRGARPVAAAA